MMTGSSTNLAEARALLLSPLGPVARAGSNRVVSMLSGTTAIRLQGVP